MSMTKQFTAAGVVKLRMNGRLRLTDTIDTFFPNVPDDKRAITIADLLDQTSGLVESLGDDYDLLTKQQMIMKAMRSRLLSPPGRAYHYSNVGYSLLAAIIERVSHTSYERFLHRALFEPAGMTHTGYVLAHWNRGDVATEYDGSGRAHGKPFEHPWAPDGPYWNLRGNGGLLSTAGDMLRWHRALLGHSVLDRRAKRELFKPRVLEEPGSDYRYAFGWDIVPSRLGPLATHNGGNGWSFGALGRFLSKGTFVFWISNHAYQRGKWNLENLDPDFTIGLGQYATG